jgi:hypothetical protein
LSLAKAREIAAEKRGQILLGGDFAEEMQAQKEAARRRRDDEMKG